MAAPVAGYVQLPDDASNTGAKIRTQVRTVGANSVEEHYFIPISKREIKGVYYFAATAAQSVQASAQNGTSTGFFWWELPSGSNVKARLRKFEVVFEQGAAPTADHLTLPRIVLARYTFTGTASGASITPAKRASGDSGNVSNVRTAVTGQTVTVGAVVMTYLPPGIDFATAVGQNVVSKVNEPYAPQNEDEFIELAAGEGLLLYQPDAGTTSDVRRFNFKGIFDEYDNA
jgi:hypothetical protein